MVQFSNEVDKTIQIYTILPNHTSDFRKGQLQTTVIEKTIIEKLFEVVKTFYGCIRRFDMISEEFNGFMQKSSVGEYKFLMID